MTNTFYNQLNEIDQSLNDMLDFTSVRYVIKVEQDRCLMGQIILDYTNDRQVPDDLDLAALVKSLYYGKIYVTYDYYEIARDDTGEPALVKYLHDVYLDTTTD